MLIYHTIKNITNIQISRQEWMGLSSSDVRRTRKHTKGLRVFHLASEGSGRVRTRLRVKARMLKLTSVSEVTSMLTLNRDIAQGAHF